MKKWIRASLLLLFVISTATPGHMDASRQEDQETLHIEVNLWSNTLTLKRGDNILNDYPIAPGKKDTPTPIGEFIIVEKSSGWGGGFGSRWLGLNVPWGNYGIHGTNQPWLIGKRVSSGCIRMKNIDVEDLYEKVPVGTPVKITGPIPFRNISRGSKGSLVLLVQQRLKGEGYYNGKVNGIFDSQTEDSVKHFQRDHHLPQTGGMTKKEFRLLGLIESYESYCKNCNT